MNKLKRKHNTPTDTQLLDKVFQKTMLSFYNTASRFNTVKKGSVISITKKTHNKTVRKSGTCIYKDDKLIVLKMKNYNEAFNLVGFINYWEIERVDNKCYKLFV
jgi:hypothetical protein